MVLGKHIRELTVQEVEELVPQVVTEYEESTYSVEGVGGYPGRFAIPAQSWYNEDGTWQYTEDGAGEEFVQTGDMSAKILFQEEDGTIRCVHKSLVEER